MPRDIVKTERTHPSARGTTVRQRSLRATDGTTAASSERSAMAVLGRSENGFVSSLLRGLAILDSFADAETGHVVGVADIARRLAVSKSSASRLAATLEAAGYLERVSEGRYRLGHRVRLLGRLAAGASDIRAVARPTMEWVVESCGETVHLGTLDGVEATTVDYLDGTHALRMHASIGSRNIAHRSAIGKVLLAAMRDAHVDELFADVPMVAKTPQTITSRTALKRELREIRKHGYAYDNEETEAGMRCVGAPVFDGNGLVLAAISISGPASRVNAETLDRLADLVKGAAVDISERLGAPESARHWGPAPTRRP